MTHSFVTGACLSERRVWLHLNRSSVIGVVSLTAKQRLGGSVATSSAMITSRVGGLVPVEIVS